ncbi:MAG: TetR/AcrR family transcriptional regulator [Bacteroidota bacterium]
MSTETPASRRGRPKTLDSAHTLDVAMLSYWQEQPGALGVNEICRRAGISKPGFYREFGGEDGLMVAVLNHYWERVVRPSLQPLAADRPFSEVLGTVLDWLTQDRETPAGCLFSKMRAAPDRLGSETAARVAVLREEMRRAYQAWFERGLARNEVNAAISPELAGILIDTQLMTVQIQMAVGEPPDQVRSQAQWALSCLLPS